MPPFQTRFISLSRVVAEKSKILILICAIALMTAAKPEILEYSAMRWYIFASSALAAGAIARLPAVLERLQLIYNSIGKISAAAALRPARNFIAQPALLPDQLIQ